MSIYGWIWFGIFGLACPVGMATTVFYGAPLLALLALLLIPAMYVFARLIFWSPYGF
jgi:multidrug efflux pump subunit AcrB